MLITTQLAGFGGGGGGYTPDAAIYDGTNDNIVLSANLTGAVDTKLGFFSGWVNLNGGDGTAMRLFDTSDGGGGNFYLQRGTDNKWLIWAHDSGVTAQALGLRTVATYVQATGWHHIASSWNGTTGLIYVNDAADVSVEDLDDTNRVGLFATVTFGSATGGSTKLNASVADFIYAQEFIDISVEATRRNFINADGTAPDWATALAAVTTPLAAFHLDDGEAAANFADNADGTGQAFSITGTLTSENGPNG